MQKYICLNNSILILSLLLLASCEKVFIPDPIDPRLPKYTEHGYDVAGAFVNQDVWRSVVQYGFNNVVNMPSMDVYSSKDSVVLSFDGQIVEGKNEISGTSITFHLQDINIHTFDDLKTLNNRIIQLDGVKNYGAFVRYDNTSYNPTCSGTAGIGQIYFRNITVNEVSNSAVLSGTFGFTMTNVDCGTTEISYGRFDYRIVKDTDFRVK